jgi:hypothetical protein
MFNLSLFNNRGGVSSYRNYGLAQRGGSFWGYPFRKVAGGVVDANGTVFTGKPGVTQTDPNKINDPVFIPQKGSASCGC